MKAGLELVVTSQIEKFRPLSRFQRFEAALLSLDDQASNVQALRYSAALQGMRIPVPRLPESTGMESSVGNATIQQIATIYLKIWPLF